MTTLFGKIQIKRKAYSAPGHKRLYPLDKALNLPRSKYSYGLQEYICSEAGLRSFDETLREMDTLVAGPAVLIVAEHLVKDRMDRTGARWRILGAEAVLKMRALKTNDDFENYWDYFQSQAFERNYAAIKVFPKQSKSPLNTCHEMDCAA